MVAGVFRYVLVSETSGEPLGAATFEHGSWEVGDLIPCHGHMFEIRLVEDSTLYVRRVL